MTSEHRTLNERGRRILATLVRAHIDTGEPVASQVLVRRGGFGLSSATIRNVLSQLESLGYVRQPHSSAGRVPTDIGYRAYVDELLQDPRLPHAGSPVDAQLREQLALNPDAEAVLAAVSHMLSQASHAVAFALIPASEAGAFHRIQFVRLGGGRVLVIVVARTSHVTHKVIELDEELPTADLEQASTYLNTEFSGLPLADVRRRIQERLSHERVLYDKLMARALRLARSSFDQMTAEHSLFVEGASSLVNEVSEPYSGITLTALGALVTMMEDRQRLVHLLSEYIDGPGLTVVIGGEHPDPALRQFSLVASTYVDGDTTGTVGLIGPMRMQYSVAIPMVGGAAYTVSRVLSHAGRPPHASDS